MDANKKIVLEKEIKIIYELTVFILQLKAISSRRHTHTIAVNPVTLRQELPTVNLFTKHSTH